MNAPVAVEKFLYAVLSADSTLNTMVGGRFHNIQAPKDATYPHVVYFPRSGRKTKAIGESKWMQSIQVYNIKVVSEEEQSTDEGDRINNRIDEVLADKEAVVSFEGQEYFVRSASQDIDIRYATNDAEIRRNHIGGVYTIVVSPKD